jgi:hypothetical protein
MVQRKTGMSDTAWGVVPLVEMHHLRVKSTTGKSIQRGRAFRAVRKDKKIHELRRYIGAAGLAFALQ